MFANKCLVYFVVVVVCCCQPYFLSGDLLVIRHHMTLLCAQASHDPSAHRRVRLSLICRLVQLCTEECNYALWNVIIALHYA